jgi:glutamate racemase
MVKESKYFLLILLFAGFFVSSDGQDRFDSTRLFKKGEITIAITDSGLGGLSVMNDIASKMKASGCFSKVNLIFVNALFDANTGYNSLQSREEKITVFNNVLRGIDSRFHPDVILIACNTLSVIYKETDFVKESNTPVLGIVESGIQLIREKLEADTSSRVIIFGTETTIEENSHKKALLEMNFSEERIITKACPELQSYIEQNPSGEETEMLISVYLGEALESIPADKGAVFLSLNCSHFGYSEELWKKTINNSPYNSGGILNPNYIMGNFLVPEKYSNRYSDTRIIFQIFSKVELINNKSMINFFRAGSPDLVKALEKYNIISDLF